MEQDEFAGKVEACQYGTRWRPVNMEQDGTGAGCLGPVGWLHKCEMDMEHVVNPNLIVVEAKCGFVGFISLVIPAILNRWPDL